MSAHYLSMQNAVNADRWDVSMLTQLPMIDAYFYKDLLDQGGEHTFMGGNEESPSVYLQSEVLSALCTL